MTDQTILVVDDDPKIRTLLRNVLEDDGFAVHAAETRSEVLAALSTQSIDLITLDINLAKDNGVDLAREIRQNSQVSIIMVTGKDDVIDRVVGLEVGADDYITKPFHLREVLARVRTVLRRSSGARVHQHVSTVAAPPGTEDSPRYSFDGMIATPNRLELLDRTGADCALTSGDFKLLSVFLERPKHVLSRDQLMDLTGELSGARWIAPSTIRLRVCAKRSSAIHRTRN
ncbi:response regulator transcription factor [Tateyamaria armeniaca]|uniref:Response regulator transcription factor n=1 Tax=Tateyamaria armeniaca TaxID=2518930 RepID=A0ABW8UZJ4_9RHOB